jgi:GDP-L-fucose synthase
MIPINPQFYLGKRVLVAGGTGMIGIPLVKRLVELGAAVTAVSMDSVDFARRVLPPGVDYQRVDLTDVGNCRRSVMGFEMIFNLVGIKGSVGIGQSKVASYLVPMLRFQTNLIEAAFEARADRYLFVSSICAYPRSAIAKEEDTVWHGAPLQNDRIPGLAKRIGETLAEAYLLEHGWKAPRIVRPSNVFGPFDDFNPQTGQVIPSLIAKMCSGAASLKVWGDGSAKRDFVFSENLADWILVAMEKAEPCIPVNLGAGSAISISQLVEELSAIILNHPKVTWDASMPAGDPIRHLSIKRAVEMIGYNPGKSFSEGLAQTVAWFLKNPHFSRS